MTTVTLNATAPIAPPPVIEEAPPVPMQRVKLLKNYRPGEAFEILGYWKPEIIVKNQRTGKEEMISPAEFIEGENAPPPQAGVGFKDKLWAGTVIRLTKDEAKRAQKLGIGELEVDD